MSNNAINQSFFRHSALAAAVVATIGLAGFNVACEDDAELDVDTQSANIVPVLLQQEGGNTATSEGIITIEKTAPSEAKLGETIEYTIDYANTSGGNLNGLVITEQLPEGFQYESANPEPSSQDGNVLTFRMDAMRDGDTGSIAITGTPQQLGDLQACTSYEVDRGVCSVLSVVNPELRLTKSLAGEGPFSVCTPVELIYTLTNEGDTAASGVSLFDELPEGMTFVDEGDNSIDMEVGELQPGQSVEKRVMVRAEQPDTYGSYAIARGEATEVKSERVETTFAAPELTINTSPDRPFTYVGDTARFQVTVRNSGDVAADSVVLAAAASEGGEIERIYVSDENQADDGRAMLGRIEPGQSRTIYVDVSSPEEAGQVKMAAVAQAVCRDTGAELARGESLAQVEVRTISALQLEVVDKIDPVQVGGETVYEVTIINEGSGDDTNLKVKAELPKGTSFVSADGATDVSNDGSTVTMTPVDTLASGDSVTWYVTVKADEATGGQKFNVTMSSDHTGGEVTEAEPTRLY